MTRMPASFDDSFSSLAEETDPIAPPASVDAGCLQRVVRSLEVVDAAAAEIDDAADVRLSVVIPVYNERETLPKIVRQVQAVGLHHEIIIVDDSSNDGTRELLAELGRAPDIRVVLHEQNQGKGAALRTALAHVTGDVILIQDADLEYDPADYPQLLAPINRGQADVVYGSRYLENHLQDRSRLHRLGNRLLTTASNLLTGQRLTDMETCYKVFRRELLESVVIEQDRFGFEPEITAKLSRRGVKIREVPIRYRSRGYAEGKKIGALDGINAFYCILRYAWSD